MPWSTLWLLTAQSSADLCGKPPDTFLYFVHNLALFMMLLINWCWAEGNTSETLPWQKACFARHFRMLPCQRGTLPCWELFFAPWTEMLPEKRAGKAILDASVERHIHASWCGKEIISRQECARTVLVLVRKSKKTIVKEKYQDKYMPIYILQWELKTKMQN